MGYYLQFVFHYDPYILNSHILVIHVSVRIHLTCLQLMVYKGCYITSYAVVCFNNVCKIFPSNDSDFCMLSTYYCICRILYWIYKSGIFNPWQSSGPCTKSWRRLRQTPFAYSPAWRTATIICLNSVCVMLKDISGQTKDPTIVEFRHNHKSWYVRRPVCTLSVKPSNFTCIYLIASTFPHLGLVEFLVFTTVCWRLVF